MLAPKPDTNEGSPLSPETLHAVLLPRIRTLHDYVAKRIPARFQATIAPEDILQGVWVAAYRALPRFDPKGPQALERWLTTIADHAIIDALRTARRCKRGGDRWIMGNVHARLSSLSDLFGHVLSPERTPSRVLHAVEAEHAVLIAIQRLKGARRRAIELHYIEGLSRREVALQLGRSPAAVDSLLSQGRRQLGEFLGDAAKYFSDARSAERSAPGRSGPG